MDESKVIEQKEPTEEERKNTCTAVFQEDGFFVVVAHESRGPRELLGLLEQAKDVVKGHFIAKVRAQMEAQGVIRPNGDSRGGFFKGMRNKWRP
jgi:hypothetical protein